MHPVITLLIAESRVEDIRRHAAEARRVKSSAGRHRPLLRRGGARFHRA